MTSDGNGGIVLDGQFQNPVVDPWTDLFGGEEGAKAAKRYEYH